ncbi:MFS transporter [Fodinisporobacter ferrooxydans]|uniref:MFS transporter n=1 Tax=Fodinisporobacter ferrooxydans TaxID=2901836 RepID=A0ABY4CNJ8_9BACL|nr:MFS transporter [Alicyclobacillaceae bacterium MYW30-H2]
MSSASIADRLNRLPISPFHKKATVIIGLGTFFDLYDIFLSGALAAVLAKQFHVDAKQLPLLIGSSFLGMFFGAVFLGRMADRLGRKRTYMFTLLVYSIFTLLGAFSTSVTALILFRFLAGIGLGVELPLCDVYLGELLPAAKRGRYTAWAYTLGFLGVPCVGFLARWLIPLHPLGIDGWRWIFILGSLGAVIVWFLRRDLPESPRWLESAGRKAEAEQLMRGFEAESQRLYGKLPELKETVPVVKTDFPFSKLFGREYIGRTVMLYIFQILQTFGYYGFGSLVPIILSQKGFAIVSSLGFTALSFIGYPVGSYLSLFLVERMERKWLISLSAFLMAGFGLLFGLSGSAGMIVAFGFLYTLVSNIFSNSFHIYQAEIFPTAVRATAAGSAYSLSRIMSGLMPFVLLPVLKQYGATTFFGVVACAMILIIVDIALLGPKTTGRSLESVNRLPVDPAVATGGSDLKI